MSKDHPDYQAALATIREHEAETLAAFKRRLRELTCPANMATRPAVASWRLLCAGLPGCIRKTLLLPASRPLPA